VPDKALRQEVEAALVALFGKPVGTHWSLDPAVLAGLTVRLDGYVWAPPWLAHLMHSRDAPK
jgi:F0F1-type ATP synthase delta subunit